MSKAAGFKSEELKRLAAGRCHHILASVCGFTDRQLNPKIHQPCPDCGGTDRFRALDDVADSGAVWCNNCHNGDTNPRSGDIFATIQWATKCDFPEAMRKVADALGHHQNGHQKPAKTSEKPKKIHATAEDALKALAWGMVQDQILDEQRRPDAVWWYYDASAQNIGQVARWNLPDGRKEIRQVSWKPASGSTSSGWVTSAMESPRPLYNLPAILKADTVFVAEGEKAADALQSLGLVATTSAGGCKAPEKTNWTPLDGKSVVIVPDADEPGEGYVRTVLELLKEQAPSAVVQVVRLRDDWPEIPEGGDAFDWSEHHDSADAEALRARLDALPDRVSDYEPKSEADKPKASKLVFHDAWQAAHKPKPLREVIIEGLLRRGEVGNAIAATKVGKSWFALLLLMCVAIGRDWLGRRVAKGNVLLIDNELHQETIENRLAAVWSALQIDEATPKANFEYVVCRGNWLSLSELMAEIPKRHPAGSLNLIVIDAKYRLFGNGLEENSNDDQTEFHNQMDAFASVMNCPILLVHHSSKGDQNGKAVTDVGSGGGSQARAVDLHLTIRPHQTEGMAVMEAGIRSFAKVEPVSLRWNFPLWEVAEGVKPVLCKDAKEQSRRAEMEERVRKYLSEDWTTLSKLAERCSTKKDRPPFADILDEMEQAGELERTDEFTPPRSNKTTEAVRLLTSDKTTSDTVRGLLSGVRG